MNYSVTDAKLKNLIQDFSSFGFIIRCNHHKSIILKPPLLAAVYAYPNETLTAFPEPSKKGPTIKDGDAGGSTSIITRPESLSVCKTYP